MAKGKPTPERSKIERGRAPLAYARRQKDGDPPAGETKSEKAEPAADKSAEATSAKPAETSSAKPTETPGEKASAKATETPAEKPGEKPAERPTELTAEVRETIDPPALEAPPPPKGEPWPDATPQPMRPVEPPKAAEPKVAVASSRARTETITVPSTADFGSPPPMPGTVEEPTRMPGPRDIPGGNVADAALPPGRVPSGDSRSLRHGNEFALIYRVGTAVITRFGTVGQRGQWRVVEYPTPASASSSFAKEVSRFVGEGFVDYRE